MTSGPWASVASRKQSETLRSQPRDGTAGVDSENLEKVIQVGLRMVTRVGADGTG